MGHTFPDSDVMGIPRYKFELPLAPLLPRKPKKHGATKYWLVFGHVIWGDLTTFDHIEINDQGTIELEGSVIVP